MKEDLFINIIKEKLPQSARYIGDDTAYIIEKDLIITQDTMIEDVHFRMSTISPYKLGEKASAINLSDIAASGGIPRFMTISLSMPHNISTDFLENFYDGLANMNKRFGVIVVGGDLTKADKITISITAIGEAQGISPAKRSRAIPGDIVATTGEFGSSGLGFYLLENNTNKIESIPTTAVEHFIKAHTSPTPQINTGRKITEVNTPRTVMMDTSDGLADALIKISKASNTGMEIDYDKIPVNSHLAKACEQLNLDIDKLIFYGGEDYELLSVMPEENYNKLINLGINLHKIGKITENKEIKVFKNNETLIINDDSINNNLFSHFGE